jgi:hypothetical protein
MVKLRQRSGGALLILAGLVVGLFPLVATAAPVDDGGQDTAWSEPMNHEPYWEDYFAAAGRIVECTKFENHSGFIPARYEAAVVKDGNFVRIYEQQGPYQALGPWNPSSGKHFEAPHSWVMKCNFEETPTYTVKVEKKWLGDDQGSAVATILLNGVEGPISGLLPGDEVIISESVSDMPEGCVFTAEPSLPWTYIVDPDDAKKDVIKLELRNTVECAKTPPKVTLEFQKDWQPPDVEDEVTVDFYVNDEGPYSEGEVIDVTDLQGEEVALAEQVTGLSDNCTFESDLPLTYRVPVLGDYELELAWHGHEKPKSIHEVIEVTNVVTCVEDKGSTTTSTTEGKVAPTVVTTTEGTTTTTSKAVVSSVEAEAETLPFTGSGDLGWLALAVGALAVGSILVVTGRKEEG